MIDPIRPEVHQVQPHAISITQASEYGRVYLPSEVAAIGALAKERGLVLDAMTLTELDALWDEVKRR